MIRSAQIILFAAQALFWSCAIIGITVTSLVGEALASDPALATLPIGLLLGGSLLSVHPLSLFMQRHGRRVGFLIGSGAGVVGALVAALAVHRASFPLFCLGAALIGTYQASAMFYRFAAVDSAPPNRAGRAAALVLAGGVVAALLGPTIAVWSRDLMAIPFMGAYLTTAVVAATGFLVLLAAPEGRVPGNAVGGWAAAKALLARPKVRAALMVTASGHGMMILVMTATPLAMAFCAFDLSQSAQVIQWHVLGMFLPGFISGRLVDKLGAGRVAVIGGTVLLVSVGVALSGVALGHFLASSLLLGAGWNLMMIAGTTLLGQAHAPEERGNAQGLMELANGLVAATASFASGALLAGAGWSLINMGVAPVLVLVALGAWFQLFGAGRQGLTEAAGKP
ncbi:MAG: MFS transporter [Rhodospirillum sp.]|nr:MFS transporter [Rhodospirillum sp.]MCF8489399.1 MFS transporter [Rhodospirillum sp.]MCF8500893.1 MFS transporter [Rhodospirillum sp.]